MFQILILWTLLTTPSQNLPQNNKACNWGVVKTTSVQYDAGPIWTDESSTHYFSKDSINLNGLSFKGGWINDTVFRVEDARQSYVLATKNQITLVRLATYCPNCSRTTFK